MKCIFVITAFVLLVIGESSLSGSQLNIQKRLKRDYKYFDEKGRPYWGDVERNHYMVFDESKHPIWGGIENHFTLFDETNRPTWGTIGTTPNTLDLQPPTNTQKSLTKTTKTTSKENEHFTLFDETNRPTWGTIGTTPNTLDHQPLTNTEKSPTRTTSTTTNENEPPNSSGNNPITTEQPPTTTTEKKYISPIITEEELRIHQAQRANGTVEHNLFPGEEDPCKRELPPMNNNFSAPGKRIALQKCEEYREIESNRLLHQKKEDDCQAYRIRHNTTDTGVINGIPTQQGEYPHMGAIGWITISGDYDFECAGILISSDFVLTAAHCAKAGEDNKELDDLLPKIVRFGDSNIIDESSENKHRIDVPILVIIKHSEHKSPSTYNDIALLMLEEEVKFNKDLRPACLWHQLDTAALGTKAKVTGWGKISAWSQEISPRLLQAELAVVDNKICNETLQPYLPICCKRSLPHGIIDTQICATDPTGRADACKGDSGGPLQIVRNEEDVSVYYVVGLTSNGLGCGALNIPGVYTRVSSFLDWIESCVWGDINSQSCTLYSKRIT